ncbi:MAG: hypothetical protein ABIP48_20985 [Planctomycetota bacterium]
MGQCSAGPYKPRLPGATPGPACRENIEAGERLLRELAERLLRELAERNFVEKGILIV